MNRISPVWEKCINRKTNMKTWFLKAYFVVAAVWMLSLTSSIANAQTPGNAKTVTPGNANSNCNSATTSEPTDPTELLPGPTSNNYSGFFSSYLGGGGFAYSSVAVVNSAIDLMNQIAGNTHSTVATNNPNQTQTVAANTQNQTQNGPCIVKR